MTDRESLYKAALARGREFCQLNAVVFPEITRLATTDRLYHLATCAYYRPRFGITIMVEKCANRGFGGRAWSWPGYAIDRTPYGVIQHELAHHVDHTRSDPAKSRDDVHSLFSWKIYQQSKEPALTGYLGTDERAPTFFMEWFAENFRLYVTNPDLSWRLRPKFYGALEAAGLRPIPSADWEVTLRDVCFAPPRIVEQARKKIASVPSTELALE